MSLVQMSFNAISLARQTSLVALLPQDAPEYAKHNNPNYTRDTKTLYLLHGYSGCEWDWMLNSPIQDIAYRYNMAIIMPDGSNSFYLNGMGTGNAYADFTGKELVDFTRRTLKLSCQSEDTFIGGFSMGGYGSLHTAIAYPENFSRAFGLSCAYIVPELSGKKKGYQNGYADYDYYAHTFGDLDALSTSSNSIEYLVKNQDGKKDMPKLFMACGTEDFLLEANRDLYHTLQKSNISVTYKESTGNHDFRFWNEYMEPAVNFLLNSEIS